jgi:hypothetical protein
MIFKAILCTLVAGGNTIPYGPYLTLFGARGACGAKPRLRVMASPYWASRSHSLDTPQSVGLLWTTHQLDAETSASQHTIITTNKHSHRRRGSNPQSQQASRHRSTPQTTRPRGLALTILSVLNILLSYLNILLSNSYSLTLPHNTKWLKKNL